MNAERDTGGPAFPHEDSGSCAMRPGMTLRDYFAAAALQGMLAAVEDKSGMEPTYVATAAYVWADKMLKARKL
jgi:hypothetical protein